MKRAVQTVAMLIPKILAGKFLAVGASTLLALVAVFGGLAVPAQAGQHPVALDKDVTAAKCVECHEAKTKGKVIHPAIQQGCFACHVVRQAGSTTRVNLKNGRASTLCFSCHANKQPASIAGHVHSPAQNDCLKCHDPHVSENENLLLKNTSGATKADNLCLQCHTQGVDVPQGGSRHAALDMGCTTCHTNHKAGERGKQEFDFHLTKSTPALCLDCHDVKDKALADAHKNQPFANADCVECHNPHQSKSPKLMQAFLHQPFEDRKSCDTCHQAAQDGKVVLTQATANALCATCHETQVKQIASAKVPHPGAQGDCVDCHSPHGGKSARFMKPNPVAACTACHTAQAEMLAKKPVLHDPAFNQRCSICHEAHGGDRDHLLRADVDTVCLACHGPDAKAVKADQGQTIMGGTVLLPADYLDKVPRVNPRAGHPVPMHPVTGKDPRDSAKSLTCVSCHDPHAGVRANQLLSADGSTRAMCQQCHKQKEQSQ